MTQNYTVHFQGPDTQITSSPDGPWPRWDMARLAAIVHLRDHVAGCLKTLKVLRRAASFYEYEVAREEMAGSEVAHVEGCETLW